MAGEQRRINQEQGPAVSAPIRVHPRSSVVNYLPSCGVARRSANELPVGPALGELASFRPRNWPFYWFVDAGVHFLLFSFVRLAGPAPFV
jgi:hypothetical protein